MGLIYTDRVGFVKDNSHPLGETKAYFATTSDLAKAFSSVSGAPGLTAKGGIITMGRDQINARIEQLGGDPAHPDKDGKLVEKVQGPVAELRKGLASIDRTNALQAKVAKQPAAVRM